MREFRIWGLFIAPVAVIGLTTIAHAQTKSDFDGAAIFRSSCVACHGVKGDGDGPVAAALNKKMKPLSGLTKAHGGEFPAEYVYQTIDGRVAVTAHGSRDMPVWGDYFGRMHNTVGDEPNLTATESSTRQIIKGLVEHVRLLQAR